MSVGSWSQGPKVELHLLAPLSQWTKSTARPKLQIQILAVACAVLRHTLPSFFLLGTIRNQLQVNASTFAVATGQWLYRCVGWRSGDDDAWPQRYLRRRASSLNNAAGRWQMLKIFLIAVLPCTYKRRNDARESHEYNEPGAGGGGTRGEKEGKAMHCRSS